MCRVLVASALRGAAHALPSTKRIGFHGSMRFLPPKLAEPLLLLPQKRLSTSLPLPAPRPAVGEAPPLLVPLLNVVFDFPP
eukprot:Skav209486  [mRNA]  locus=scaffold1892:155882:157128:- [translate_table: standard]